MPEKQRLMAEDHWSWSISTPFSQGWRCGDFVFVGGQVSADEQARAIGVGDIEVQTRNTLENVRKVLRTAGADMSDIVKMNTFYVFDGEGDAIQEFWEQMTRVRMEFFEEPGPCGTAVRVSGFAFPDLLIEIEAIAYSPLST
jgi:enamine deaminase RidA (YjgF/YER057c/UK114 family)